MVHTIQFQHVNTDKNDDIKITRYKMTSINQYQQIKFQTKQS